MVKLRKGRLKETLSINGIIAVVIIISSVTFCFVRTVFFGVNIWDILDSAVVNVVCSAVIFLIFDVRDASRSLRLTKVVNAKMKKSIKDWDAIVHILECDTDERLRKLNELDMSKPQPGSMVYVINGEIENPSYYKVLRTETNKFVMKMKEFQDVYFDFLDPEIVVSIDKILNSWRCSETLFNTTKNENDVIIIGDGSRRQEKFIVFSIRQITEEIKTINKVLNK